MNDALPRWELQIRGDEADLEHLARFFSSGPLTVFSAEPNGYLLHSEVFGTCRSSAEVHAVAVELLAMLSGLLQLGRRSLTAITGGAVFWRRADGIRDAFLHVQSMGNLVRFGEHEMIATDSDGQVIQGQNTVPRTRKIADLALIEPVIATAMRLWAAPDSRTWTGLFRITELVESDMDGWQPLVEKGWISKTRRERFRRTANHPLAAGDASRHGCEDSSPPANPMDLVEAQAYVEELVQAWVSEKLSPPDTSGND